MPFDSTPQTDPVLQRLRDARAKLAQGWVQGREVYRGSGHEVSYCMIGAVRFDDDLSVSAHDPVGSAALEYIARVLPVYCPGQHMIASYNDAAQRTHAEVLATMDQAIALREKALAS